MRRRLLLAPVLLLTLLPAVSAQACGSTNHYVDTLTVVLPPAPTAVKAGAPTGLTVTVTRAGTPAGGVDVYLRLQHGAEPSAVTYGSGRTEVDGTTELRADVPRSATGRLQVTVEAFSLITALPCHGSVEEHGLARAAWGRVAR